MRALVAFAGCWSVCCAALAAPSFRTQEISNRLGIGYAVRLVDVNGDRRLDVVVVDKERVVWFENPAWTMHTLLAGATKPDNVCLAPHDIDGDGKLDFALGADWRPFDTRGGGTIQWLARGASPGESWSVHPIGAEPTVHRLAWGDLDGDGRAELVVVPLMGRNSTGPHFAESGVRILAYKVPADPARDPWPVEVLNDELHVAHNFEITDLDRDRRADLIVASFEGVSWLRRGADGKWTRTRLGSGNQQTTPNRGASEIKLGRLADGGDYIATIEPWHGFQAVVYTRPAGQAAGSAPAEGLLWTRHVLDERLQWGHAVCCANLDDDDDQELVIGVRDKKDETSPHGVRVYDPQRAAPDQWQRSLVDPAGVAVEDLAVADLDGDGRQDLVAVGRATKNVRIYWNQGSAKE